MAVTTPPSEFVLTLAEAGQRMNASERQVRRWIDTGKLGYVRLPHGRHVLVSHIEEFLAERNVTPLEQGRR